MTEPGRGWVNASYRYGFNGKENDRDVKGEGNQQDYGERIYDPRIGRFLSVDPITADYPELTPYQYASNRPIDGIDLDGLEYSPARLSGSGQLARESTTLLRYPDHPAIIIQSQQHNRISYIKAAEPNYWKKVEANIEQLKKVNFGLYLTTRLAYNTADDIYITYSGYKNGRGYAQRLNGEHGLSYKETIGAGLNTASLVFGGIQAAGEKALVENFVSLSIGEQGKLGESFFGNNLSGKISPNFKRFDNFDDGVATSVKSLNLSAQTYLENPSAITSRLNQYLDKIDGFEGTAMKGFVLDASMIETRELGLLTLGRATQSQTRAINASMQYAQKLGIKFTLKNTGPSSKVSLNNAILTMPKNQ